jgi:hypothetical protein
MQTLPEVQTAKLLMTEAVNWSVMKWLREKKRVRAAADQANAALDRLRRSIGQQWRDDVKTAYLAVASANGAKKGAPNGSGDCIRLAGQIKHADEDARHARMDAEETFDKAEKRLSTSLAREGCRKAIRSWELHEHAIHLAEKAIVEKANVKLDAVAFPTRF